MLTPLCRSFSLLALAGLSASLLLVGAHPAAAQYATLNLQSQPGDGIGQGQDYSFTYVPTGALGDAASAQILTPTTAGPPEFLRFFVGNRNTAVSPFFFNYSELDFSTVQLGTPITPGVYTDAQRASFAALGHPGLDVSFDSRGSNILTGSFTVTDFTYSLDTTPFSTSYVIDTFGATFEQHSEGATPALFGQFYYSATGSPVPEASTTVSFGLLLALGLGGVVIASRKKKAAASA